MNLLNRYLEMRLLFLLSIFVTCFAESEEEISGGATIAIVLAFLIAAFFFFIFSKHFAVDWENCCCCYATRVKLPELPDPQKSLSADTNVYGIILPREYDEKEEKKNEVFEMPDFEKEKLIASQLADVVDSCIEKYCEALNTKYDKNNMQETISSLAAKFSKSPNCSQTHRRKEQLTTNLVCDGIEIGTAYACLLSGVRRNKTHGGFATRPWKLDTDGNYIMNKKLNAPEREMRYIYQTYPEIEEKSRYLGIGFVSLGNHKQSTIAIYSINRAEFQITAFGAFSQSMIAVPIYDTLGVDSVQYILHHCETATVVASKDKMENLLKACKKATNIKNVIQFDYEPKYQNVGEKVDPDTKAKFSEIGVHLYGFSEVIEIGSNIANGANSSFPAQPPEPRDIAYIMYTSGTTGVPKGVVITHSMFVAELGAIGNYILEPRWFFNKEDNMLSYLPLGIAELYCICLGVTVCYYQGSVKLLTDDLALSHPTIFCGVPRIYQRFYEKIIASMNDAGPIVKGMFNSAMASASEARLNDEPRNIFWELLFFNKCRAKLGLDRCKVMFTGAAPIQPYIMHFIVTLVNAPMIVGYGMTETTCGSNLTYAEDTNLCHVGPPLTCTEIKLEDVLSMGYTHFDLEGPRGEVLVRGPNILKQYFKNPQATQADITPDGWLHTGDVGRWNKNGTLSIIDRKKNMFKLLQGEYIAAEKLEDCFKKSLFIGQLWIYGNSLKSFLIAVVVPNAENVMKYARDEGWKVPESPLATKEFSVEFHEMCTNHYDELHTLIFNDMNRYAKLDKLQSFEVPRALVLETQLDELLQGFNVGNNCLTPTFKLKRPQLLLKYLDVLKKKYSDLNEPDKPGELWPGCK